MGLLNTKARKTGQPLLVDKYKEEGMTMSEVYAEVRSFMLRVNERGMRLNLFRMGLHLPLTVLLCPQCRSPSVSSCTISRTNCISRATVSVWVPDALPP